MIKRVLLSLFLFTGAIKADNLPDYGDPSRKFFSSAKEIEISKAYMQNLRNSGKVIEDPVDSAYINQLGKNLVAASNKPRLTFYFFFMDLPDINAFAGPNGYIAINSGLMLVTESEEELASVMAHEIAHVTQGHLARRIADMSKAKYSALAGILTAIALGRFSPSAAEAAVATTMAGSQQHLLNFGRTMEKEADRIGINTLHKAGYNAYSMANFFEKLSQNEKYTIKIPQLLSDHPLTPSRIADAQNRAAQLLVKHHVSSKAYFLIKERLRVSVSPRNEALLVYYRKTLAKKTDQNRYAIKYGYALALQKDKKLSLAAKLMDELIAEDPEEILFRLAKANIDNENRRYEEALVLLEPLYKAHPENYAVTLAYATTLQDSGQAKKALQILKRHHLDYDQDPVPYGLLAQIQAKAGHLADAYQTRARYLIEHEKPQEAIAQLEVANRLPNLTAAEKERVNAQINEIKFKIKH